MVIDGHSPFPELWMDDGVHCICQILIYAFYAKIPFKSVRTAVGIVPANFSANLHSFHSPFCIALIGRRNNCKFARIKMSSSPNNSNNNTSNNNSNNNSNSDSSSPCVCSQVLGAKQTTEKGALRTPATSSVNANILADSLGVSPLYRQQDSARWQSAHHVYQSSRAHSPVLGGSATPNQLFACADTAATTASTATTTTTTSTTSTTTIECVTPRQLHQTYYQHSASAVGSPISLEDIAYVNRRRHQEVGDTRVHESDAGALELEAVAAVHELACSVKSISVSEILPRTANLIFVNIKTHEDQPFTLELTLKGWRIASQHSDSMNGDYSNVDLHTRYFTNAREVLEIISPGHSFHFNDCLAERLKQLEKNKENKEYYDA